MCQDDEYSVHFYMFIEFLDVYIDVKSGLL